MLTVTLDRVCRSFAERRVLHDLSLEVRAGDRMVIRGANGSGKSTLLRVIAGLILPTSGTVVMGDGTPWDAATRRGRIGFVSPDLVLYDEFTALENLDLFGRLRGMPRDPNRDQALLERLEVGDRAQDLVGSLSTGLRQRVKLAFALQSDPTVVLLDEPAANLDQAGRDLVGAIALERAGAGAAVLMASNDPADANWGSRRLELG